MLYATTASLANDVSLAFLRFENKCSNLFHIYIYITKSMLDKRETESLPHLKNLILSII